MEGYNLLEDEVVLFKGEIVLSGAKANLMLTNHNLVVEKTVGDAESKIDVYSMNEVKFYKGKPQIIKNQNVVEIYFLKSEVEIGFEDKNKCKRFVDLALELVTDKSKFERGLSISAKKVKNTISIIDDTLEIDSVGLATNAVKSGIVGKTANVLGKGIKIVGGLVASKKKKDWT